LEEEQLIVDGIVPILGIVCAGTECEIVVNAPTQQSFVQGLVDFEEEITLATVDDDGEVAIVDTIDLVYD